MVSVKEAARVLGIAENVANELQKFVCEKRAADKETTEIMLQAWRRADAGKVIEKIAIAIKNLAGVFIGDLSAFHCRYESGFPDDTTNWAMPSSLEDTERCIKEGDYLTWFCKNVQAKATGNSRFHYHIIQFLTFSSRNPVILLVPPSVETAEQNLTRLLEVARKDIEAFVVAYDQQDSNPVFPFTTWMPIPEAGNATTRAAIEGMRIPRLGPDCCLLLHNIPGLVEESKIENVFDNRNKCVLHIIAQNIPG